MTREDAKNAIARALGLEDSRTIWFFQLCEDYEPTEHNDKCLIGIFEALMDLVQYEAELE